MVWHGVTGTMRGVAPAPQPIQLSCVVSVASMGPAMPLSYYLPVRARQAGAGPSRSVMAMAEARDAEGHGLALLLARSLFPKPRSRSLSGSIFPHVFRFRSGPPPVHCPLLPRVALNHYPPPSRLHLQRKRNFWEPQNAPPPSEDGEGTDGRISQLGLSQLIKMGLGTVAGDIKEINLKDPKRTVVLELEANNFEDSEGNPIDYMDNEGFVEEGGAINWTGVVLVLLLAAGSGYLVVSTLSQL